LWEDEESHIRAYSECVTEQNLSGSEEKEVAGIDTRVVQLWDKEIDWCKEHRDGGARK
jgi:hypothetical protein